MSNFDACSDKSRKLNVTRYVDVDIHNEICNRAARTFVILLSPRAMSREFIKFIGSCRIYELFPSSSYELLAEETYYAQPGNMCGACNGKMLCEICIIFYYTLKCCKNFLELTRNN